MTHRVAVIGDALIDIVDGRQIPGGAAFNVAVGLAKLGADVDLITMLADDEPGRALLRHAAEHGVRVHATDAPHGTATATATRVGESMEYVFNEAGRKRFFDVASKAAVIAEADCVVVSCVPLESDAQTEALQALQRMPIPFVLDANPRPGYLRDNDPATVAAFAANLRRLAAAATMLKLSDEDTRLLFELEPHDAAKQLLAAGLEVALVTEGPAGASIRTASLHEQRPIAHMDAPIVDTIGAGDATNATLALALLDEQPWGEALERAMLVAAATCRAPGGELQLP